MKYLGLTKIKKAVLGMMLLTATSLCAATSGTYERDKQQDTMLDGVDVPISSQPDKKVLRDRVEMNTAQKASQYKNVQYRSKERAKVINEIFDPMILMSPVTRTIRPIDTMGISPAYLTQIIFPSDMIITDMLASFETKVFSHSANSVRIQPNIDNFYSGNVVFNLSDGKKNYIMTIFMERYFKNDCEEDYEEKTYICRKRKEATGLDNSTKYAYAYNNLSTVYQYTNPKPIDGMRAILLYEKMTQKMLNIKTNEASVRVKYDGITYKIERDDRYGRIMYRGKGYRVTNSMSNQKLEG